MIVPLAFGFFSCGPAGAAQTDVEVAALHSRFLNPPDDSRIMMRWWWFGPAATKTEVTRELEQMKAVGVGGVEIANLYPLAMDDPATGFHNTPFLSPEHLEVLRFAGDEARRLELRVDVTLGSGWPFGGPHIPVAEAAQVYVNGKLAGVVRHPPYRLDVTAFVREGRNDLRVIVGNTAINALAGQAQPDYRLLWDRYGMLFAPQDMRDLKPLPSGMMGPVRLMQSTPAK